MVLFQPGYEDPTLHIQSVHPTRNSTSVHSQYKTSPPPLATTITTTFPTQCYHALTPSPRNENIPSNQPIIPCRESDFLLNDTRAEHVETYGIAHTILKHLSSIPKSFGLHDQVSLSSSYKSPVTSPIHQPRASSITQSPSNPCPP
jgi:hypothetical protein